MNLPVLIIDVSIDRPFNWLFINMKNIKAYHVSKYLEIVVSHFTPKPLHAILEMITNMSGVSYKNSDVCPQTPYLEVWI